MSKSLEEYLDADPQVLAATTAFIVENELPKITKHLETLNSTVSENRQRIDRIDMRRQVEAELQYKPSVKQVATIGGTGGGIVLCIALGIYYLIQLFL